MEWLGRTRAVGGRADGFKAGVWHLEPSRLLHLSADRVSASAAGSEGALQPPSPFASPRRGARVAPEGVEAGGRLLRRGRHAAATGAVRNVARRLRRETEGQQRKGPHDLKPRASREAFLRTGAAALVVHNRRLAARGASERCALNLQFFHISSSSHTQHSTQMGAIPRRRVTGQFTPH